MTKYKNPVIPGFHPDPSVCRVDKDYYLVNSTFEFFPGVPVYHSKDLIHWRLIGHCLTRESQLPLHKAQTGLEGIFAPTIRHHDGMFYMVTTNEPGHRNFWVSAKDPAGPWSEPVMTDLDGIDPSFLFDDDGKVYYTSNGTADNGKWSIVQVEVDLKSGKRLSERKEVWKGTGGAYPEGPHLYKINGTYYLMIAEGGTGYGHMETIARSDNPWGPFESCPRNPIMTHRQRRHDIQCTGHGDLVQDHRGNWWIVYLATRPKPGPNLGRETYLSPVTWDPDGWPVVHNNGCVEIETEADCLPLHAWEPEPVRDHFDSETLDFTWSFLRNPYPKDWSLAERPGFLRLNGSAVTLGKEDSPAFVGRRQEHKKCVARCRMDFEPKQDGDEAGLTVYTRTFDHSEIAITRINGKRRIIVRRLIGDLEAVVANEPVNPGPVVLEIRCEGDNYFFSCGTDEGSMRKLAKAQTPYVIVTVGFTGVYLGMYATGNGKKCTAPADFDWFEYQSMVE